MNSVLLLKYVKWHFFDAPQDIVKGWGNILWFTSNLFSIGLLLKTYFAPWRRITWSYGRGFDIGRYLFIFASNIVSRVLGAIMRTFLIVAGIGLTTCCLVAGAVLFLLWFCLLVIIVAAFVYGLFLLF